MTDHIPRHGGQLHAIAERFDRDPASLLDLSANISPQGPPASALAAMQQAFTNRQCFTQYPDLDETHLKQSLAAYAGTSTDQVSVANGFVPLLDATVRALGLSSCLLPIPCFNEYRRVLEHCSITIEPYPLQPEQGFRYLFDSLSLTTCEAVLLANPQNPTGVLCDREALIDFVERAQQQGVYVLLDEAFIDYLPGQSLASLVGTYSHLIVFRSLTKFFGMPGLRVAYALACHTLTSRIEIHLAPWPITTLASIAAAAAVADKPYAQSEIDLNIERRAYLHSALAALNLKITQAAANFLFFELEDAESHWQTLIQTHGIVLRLCDNYEGLSNRYLRVAVRDHQSTDKLIHALRAILSESNPHHRR